MNHFKTYMLLAGLTAPVHGGGLPDRRRDRHADRPGLRPGLNAFSYWNADKIVLRTYGAVEVDESHPERAASATTCSTRSRWPARPACRVRASRSSRTPSPTPSPRAAIRPTPPWPPAPACCSLLDRDEIRGVMAHELAHVKNRDTLVMTVTATIAGAISALANFAFFFGGSRDEVEGNGGGSGRHDRRDR